MQRIAKETNSQALSLAFTTAVLQREEANLEQNYRTQG